MVVCSAYSRIASIHCWAMRAGIHCSSIWMVVSYEIDRVVKICVFMASLVIFSVVPISFLRKPISLVKYWVTVSFGDGREAVNCRRTWVWPSFVEALSSRSLRACYISMGWSISSMSESSSSQDPRCIGTIALLALPCQSYCRVPRVTPLQGGRGSTPVTIW